tara:strand:- start:517 stop:966 length:450 start_codon:yes stop_codon:yes gene_type:complete
MKKNKPKQLEFNFNKTFTEASNKYDNTNYIYNPADNGIYTEKELKKKFTATDTYNLLKSVANQQEKKEFRDIERKYKKKKPIAQRTEPFSNKDDTGAAVKIDIAPFPFENTITHTYGAIEDAKVEEAKPVVKPKKQLAGLAYILGVDDA